MNQAKQLSEQLIDEYSIALLNWAYRKLGDRTKAEDLVQSVWVEVFHAIRKEEACGRIIEKPEHLIWKIAHYVWCHYLRQDKKQRVYIAMEEMEAVCETDFVEELAEEEEVKQQLKALRCRISRLNYLQREIMISFYMDGQSQKTIAERLQITEAAVKWHLFDTRKKLKEELMMQAADREYVYRPHTLHMGMSGSTNFPIDIDVIKESLTKQNICVDCYQAPRTLDELAERLGLPKAYLEFDLEWLVRREFLEKTPKGYITTFLIENAQYEQERGGIFKKYKEQLADVITAELLAAEPAIRKIGFWGADQSMDRLLWMLIYRIHTRLKLTDKRIERPQRPDGGFYFPIGFDKSGKSLTPGYVDLSNWKTNGPMWSEGAGGGMFCWYGLHHFAQADSLYIICHGQSEWSRINKALCKLIQQKFSVEGFEEEERLDLAKLIEKEFVRKEGEKAYPTFAVFTGEQYEMLEQTVFDPIIRKLETTLEALQKDMHLLAKRLIPAHLSAYEDLFVEMTAYRSGSYNTFFAFEDGLLYRPVNEEEGKLLTLLYIAP